MPNFLDKTTEILSWMKGLEKDKLKAIWKCNDKIARQNFERLENMDLYHMLTPAILSYEGIAFQYMAPAVFEYGQFEYIQKHLRILSAFYGSLKPLDGVRPVSYTHLDVYKRQGRGSASGKDLHIRKVS